MAYFNEDTVKAPLLREISMYANALGVTVAFESSEDATYAELSSILTDLRAQYETRKLDQVG